MTSPDRAEIARLDTLVAELRAALAEALGIADALSNYISLGNPYAQVRERQARIAELQKLVTSPHGGVLRPDLAARYDRMADAVLALLMRRDAGLSIDEQIEQLRGLVAE